MIKANYVGLIMRTQGCSCVRMNQPINPDFISFVFVSVFTFHVPVLDPFPYIYAFKLLFHMFICLFIFHMLELGFI